MDSDLRNMIMSFRVTELQTLLGYAGKNRTGRKNELQARALDLAKSKSSPIVSKIKELYRAMQQSMAMGTNNASGVSFTNTAASASTNRGYTVTSSGYANSTEKVLQGFSFINTVAKQPLVTMPICPDVKMTRLPFYDIMSELIKPSSLLPQGMSRAQEASFPFCLTPQQANDISESRELAYGEIKPQFGVQVQLRFCSLDTSSGKDQDDQFPPSLTVKVNSKPITLPHPIPSNRPGVEPKRPSKPLNVTSYVKLSPTVTNTITVSWSTDTTKGYAMSLYLVKKLTAADLLQRLKQRGARPADYSRGLIKELIAKDDGDCMIAMTSLKVSIACPLGKSRMLLPCRATTCKHLQCFDASLFLQMNEKKPSWICPVCDKKTAFDDLSIDGYFQEVISKMAGKASMDVELLPDGSWKTLEPKNPDKSKSTAECASPPAKKIKSDTSKKLNQTINLDDDIIIEDDLPLKTETPAPVPVQAASSSQAKKSAEVIDLTLSSDSESEEEIPVRPRRKATKPNYRIDDDSSSSSSSSTSDGSVGTTRVNSPPARVRSEGSPACITLDSRSPSPDITEPIRRESNSRTQNAPSRGPASMATSSTGPFSSIGSGGPSISSSNNTTTFDYGHSLGHPTGYTRSTSSQPVPPSNVFAHTGSGYSPFENPNMWGPSSNSSNYSNPFPAPDFSQLDLDFYNYETRSNPNYRWP